VVGGLFLNAEQNRSAHIQRLQRLIVVEHGRQSYQTFCFLYMPEKKLRQA